MKTSLISDDKLFNDAKTEATKSGLTISEIITLWATFGKEVWKAQSAKKKKSFKPVNLGPEKVDLTNRKEWMESLDDDRD